jgi:C1A family cysteine protease
MADLELKTLRDSLSANNRRWEAGKTAISALPDAGMRLRLGAEPPAGQAGLTEREQRAAQAASIADLAQAVGAPAAVDWRSIGGSDYLGRVRDQANCGSCVAFGSIAAIEGSTRVAAKKPGLSFDLSEAHLFYCHGAADGRNCDNGWWPSKALDAAKSKGIVDEACFPYTAGDQACRPCSDAATRTTRIKAWTSLTAVPDMKLWIAERGPVAACFTVYEDFRYYKSGVYEHQSGAQLGGHCVCIVGYSDADRAWIARNSWGPDWGENGYFRIGYGEVGIDYEMWGVEVDPKPVVDDVVKVEKVRITGIWVNADAKDAQCYVDKLGWRKLTKPEFVTAAAAARVAKALCTLSIKGDTIIEMYVL